MVCLSVCQRITIHFQLRLNITVSSTPDVDFAVNHSVRYGGGRNRGRGEETLTIEAVATVMLNLIDCDIMRILSS